MGLDFENLSSSDPSTDTETPKSFCCRRRSSLGKRRRTRICARGGEASQRSALAGIGPLRAGGSSSCYRLVSFAMQTKLARVALTRYVLMLGGCRTGASRVPKACTIHIRHLPQ